MKNNEPTPAESAKAEESLAKKIGDELANRAKGELEGLTQQAKQTRNNILIWLFTTVKGWLFILSLVLLAVLWIKTNFWVALVVMAVVWIGGWLLFKKYFPKKK